MMTENGGEEGLTLDKRTMDVLVANIIPTSRYFEARFDHMQGQIDDIKSDIKDFRREVDKRFDSAKTDMDRRFNDVKVDMDRRFDDVKDDMDQRFEQVDKRFEQVDKRFEQVDKRFEQVDKRFEQVDKRFEQVDKRFEQVDNRLQQIIASIDNLGDKLDYREERQRNFTLRMFSIAIGISILGAVGAFLKTMGIL